MKWPEWMREVWCAMSRTSLENELEAIAPRAAYALPWWAVRESRVMDEIREMDVAAHAHEPVYALWMSNDPQKIGLIGATDAGPTVRPDAAMLATMEARGVSHGWRPRWWVLAVLRGTLVPATIT